MPRRPRSASSARSITSGRRSWWRGGASTAPGRAGPRAAISPTSSRGTSRQMDSSMEDVMNLERPALPHAGNASLVRGLPAWTYFNAELTALEYETLIRPSWQFVCHVNQLKEPGAFATLDMMRDSVIAMRGKDGVIRAFANACRHRGSRLLDGAGVCRGRITCPYHGWSYGLDGRL